MPLSPGARIGPYEVTGTLGAGGMGEVYRARDTKLGRDVALKVLPEAFTSDPDRLARFEREAKVLASLNHPHIAHIYELEETDGRKALVLELVDGPTLADRIAQGPIPLDEALPIAKQIAEALEAAHEQGIIHRDLKPANVKVRPDGAVKVLDFGLAKAYAGEAEPGGSSSNVSQSPTLAHSGTQAGVILGTAAYMSPEQARGKPVDRRADIWAFGVCLFEMLTGRRPFAGDTTTDVLAAIVGQDPRWELLERGTPPRVRDLVEQCLEKNARARLRDIGDARIALDRALAAPEDASRPSTSTPAYRRWGLIAVAALLAALGGWLLRPRLSPAAPASGQPTTRFTIDIPAGGSPPVISSDARLIAFTDSEGLKVREMDSLDVRLVAATSGWPAPPFFSPDGQWIGFIPSCCSVRRVRVGGGAPIPVLDTEVIAGASWAPGDSIVLGFKAGGLARVAIDGGDSIPLTRPRRDQGELGHTWPHVLPDGKNVLFTMEASSQSSVGVASLETGQHRILFAGSTPHYLSSGHVVFVQGGTLFAVPFSLEKLEPLGDPVPVLPGVKSGRWATGAVDYYSVSERGSLVYVPDSGEPPTRRTRLVEVDRTGQVLRLVESGNDYLYPRLSPDERVVVVSEQRETRDLWSLDLERARPTRFTFGGSEYVSAWTPEGEALAYVSTRATADLYWQKADGTEEPRMLSAGYQLPGAWSPKGDFLAVTRMEPGTRGDIWIVPRDGGKAEPFADTAYAELAPTFSPDGHYLAYVSDESGTNEVYLRPFPGPGGKVAVSEGGGSEPLWSRESNEIFYRRGDELHAVSVRRLTPTVELGSDRLLFEGVFDKTRVGPPDYDVSRDGKRFYMVQADEEPGSASQSIHVVLNWFDEVRDQIPVSP